MLEGSDSSGHALLSRTPLNVSYRTIIYRLDNLPTVSHEKQLRRTGLEFSVLDKDEKSIDGEVEPSSEGMYVVSRDDPSFIQIKNATAASVRVRCVFVDPPGTVTELGCDSHSASHQNDSSLHSGEFLKIKLEPEGQDVVVEVHFYIESAIAPDAVGSLKPALPAQTLLRMKFESTNRANASIQ